MILSKAGSNLVKSFQAKSVAVKLFAPITFLSVFLFSMPAHAFTMPCLTIFGIPFCPELNACTSGFVAGAGPLHSIGDVICNALRGSSMIPILLGALSYLFGLFLVVMGIIKTREHVEDPRSVPIWEPIKRFAAGGMFLALPIMTEGALSLVTGGGAGGGFDNAKIATGSPSGGGLDAMMFFLVMDIFKPLLRLLSGFSYIAGIILVMIGIGRMLKSSQDGPRGPGGIGTMFTFFVAGCLFAIDSIIGAVGGTFFNANFFGAVGLFGGGPNYIATMSFLSMSTGDANIDSHILAVIGSVVGFMILVGVIAFIRGIFILRDVAEGNQQASLMAAITHIVGGAFAVNIGSVMNAMQSTFGLSVVSFV